MSDCQHLEVPEAQNKNQQKEKELFVIGREDCGKSFVVQPTSSALLLVTQMFLTDVAAFETEINWLSNGRRFISSKCCYDKEIMHQTRIYSLYKTDKQNKLCSSGPQDDSDVDALRHDVTTYVSSENSGLFER